jgi:hypothetical protein
MYEAKKSVEEELRRKNEEAVNRKMFENKLRRELMK